ncbi:MAG: TIGR03435 family protein [Candidatus Sulfopaludibacter sp.]|nr:TIGR03435 family protein [Candidatus Sulfopaludibacter sp.]
MIGAWISCGVLWWAAAWGQSLAGQPARPSFDVASVKRSVPGSPTPPVMTASFNNRVQGRLGGRYSMHHVFLRTFLQIAYQLPSYRLSGPGWMDSERYDIDATMPRDTPDDTVLVMLQNLLAERFHLETHHDQRETSAYVLVVAKGGPKLTLSAEGTTPDVRMTVRSLSLKNKSIFDLANILALLSDRPVVDSTGLAGSYDIELNWGAGVAASVESQPDAASGHALSMAAGSADAMGALGVLHTLGLKAESRKVPMDFLIVDRAEKAPSGN